MKMSASPGPTGAEVLYVRLMPLYAGEIIHDGRDLARANGLSHQLLDLIAEYSGVLDTRPGARSHV